MTLLRLRTDTTTLKQQPAPHPPLATASPPPATEIQIKLSEIVVTAFPTSLLAICQGFLRPIATISFLDFFTLFGLPNIQTVRILFTCFWVSYKIE